MFHLPSRRPFSTTAASSKEEGGEGRRVDWRRVEWRRVEWREGKGAGQRKGKIHLLIKSVTIIACLLPQHCQSWSCAVVAPSLAGMPPLPPALPLVTLGA